MGCRSSARYRAPKSRGIGHQVEWEASFQPLFGAINAIRMCVLRNPRRMVVNHVGMFPKVNFSRSSYTGVLPQIPKGAAPLNPDGKSRLTSPLAWRHGCNCSGRARHNRRQQQQNGEQKQPPHCTHLHPLSPKRPTSPEHRSTDTTLSGFMQLIEQRRINICRLQQTYAPDYPTFPEAARFREDNAALSGETACFPQPYQQLLLNLP